MRRRHRQYYSAREVGTQQLSEHGFVPTWPPPKAVGYLALIAFMVMFTTSIADLLPDPDADDSAGSHGTNTAMPPTPPPTTTTTHTTTVTVTVTKRGPREPAPPSTELAAPAPPDATHEPPSPTPPASSSTRPAPSASSTAPTDQSTHESTCLPVVKTLCGLLSSKD